MDSDNNDTISDLSNFGDLAKVDGLLETAATSIDNGRYEDAINDFEQVVDITHSIFGDNIELTEVKNKILEIQQLLEQMKNKN